MLSIEGEMTMSSDHHDPFIDHRWMLTGKSAVLDISEFSRSSATKLVRREDIAHLHRRSASGFIRDRLDMAFPVG